MAKQLQPLEAYKIECILEGVSLVAHKGPLNSWQARLIVQTDFCLDGLKTRLSW